MSWDKPLALAASLAPKTACAVQSLLAQGVQITCRIAAVLLRGSTSQRLYPHERLKDQLPLTKAEARRLLVPFLVTPGRHPRMVGKAHNGSVDDADERFGFDAPLQPKQMLLSFQQLRGRWCRLLRTSWHSNFAGAGLLWAQPTAVQMTIV